MARIAILASLDNLRALIGVSCARQSVPSLAGPSSVLMLLYNGTHKAVRRFIQCFNRLPRRPGTRTVVPLPAPILFQVLHEDEQLLVVNKPAGLVCHPTKTDEYSSLISRVRLYLGPGAQPQLVNRLDRETSGVTLLAKLPQPARELRRLWEQRLVQKQYAAIVHGHLQTERGTIDAPLGRDEHSCVAIKDCVRPDGTPASTGYEVVRRFTRDVLRGPGQGIVRRQGPTPRNFTLLRLVPQTGRKHQIRIHLAHIGHPLVGDKIYGGDEDLYLALVEDRLTVEQRDKLILPHHALHASQVRFFWRDREWEFTAEPEPWFTDFTGE